MPKKTASARSGASRNKPKSQKSVQLVRPATAENDIRDESSEDEEETTLVAPASKAAIASTATASKAEIATSKKSVAESVTAPAEKDVVDTSAANNSSAGARLAARRQTTLRQQVQRNTSQVTVEHYAYVRRDLIYILILAIIMFSAIIILRFVPAIGG
jgi:hypothetical protein